MTDIKLLPLDIPSRNEFSRQEVRSMMRAYARANVEHATTNLRTENAELYDRIAALNDDVAALRAEADAWNEQARKQSDRASTAESQRDMLAEALQGVYDFILQDGCPVDPKHPKRIAIDAAREALARVAVAVGGA